MKPLYTKARSTLVLVAAVGLLASVTTAAGASPDRATADRQFEQAMELARRGETDRAIELFRRIAAEHPDWPEPFNNIAVLYARQGKYTEASKALEAALDTHPSYATAYRNLNRIYDTMASRTYQKAFTLEGSAPADTPALTLIERSPAGDQVTAAAPSPQIKTAKAPVSVENAATAEPAITVVSRQPAPAEPPSLAREDGNMARSIEKTVTGWAAAWSAQDVEAYLGFYGSGFVPPGGVGRPAWVAQRRERLTTPSRIQVTLSNVQVSRQTDDSATVTFVQAYESDSFSGTARKQLRMTRNGDHWKIVEELVLR